MRRESYSNDLRERVVEAIEAGDTREEVAELYGLPQDINGAANGEIVHTYYPSPVVAPETDLGVVPAARSYRS
jgi:hypothetical protein